MTQPQMVVKPNSPDKIHTKKGNKQIQKRVGGFTKMKCADCPYYWQDQDERFPSCKYPYNDGYAPCDVEDQEKETEDDDK